MAHPWTTLSLAFGMMTALWPLSIRWRDVSIIDIPVGAGFRGAGLGPAPRYRRCAMAAA